MICKRAFSKSWKMTLLNIPWPGEPSQMSCISILAIHFQLIIYQNDPHDPTNYSHGHICYLMVIEDWEMLKVMACELHSPVSKSENWNPTIHPKNKRKGFCGWVTTSHYFCLCSMRGRNYSHDHKRSLIKKTSNISGFSVLPFDCPSCLCVQHVKYIIIYLKHLYLIHCYTFRYPVCEGIWLPRCLCLYNM